MANAEGGSLVDSVTLVQQEIAATCSALFNYIGSLQRDAPPASVNGEAVVGPSLSGFDVDVRNGVLQGGITKDTRAHAATMGMACP